MTEPPHTPGYPDPNVPPAGGQPGYQQGPPPGYQGPPPGYQQGPPPGYQQGPPPGYQQGPPPGYQQGSPPGYQQGPPPGYPGAPGGYTPAPPGYASSEEKTWALVSTFGAAVGSFVCGGILAALGPLIAYLTKGKESATVRAHSVAALNFFLPISAIGLLLVIFRVCDYGLPSGLRGLVGLLLSLLQLAAWATGVVFGILAGLKANEGQVYKYPFSLNIVK